MLIIALMILANSNTKLYKRVDDLERNVDDITNVHLQYMRTQNEWDDMITSTLKEHNKSFRAIVERLPQ